MAISVDGQAKYARQTGGRGQYGHVVLRVIVGGPGVRAPLGPWTPNRAGAAAEPEDE